MAHRYEVYTVKPKTDSGGDATALTPAITGRLVAAAYIKTDYADGSTFTITGGSTSQSLWTESDVDASARRYPRRPTQSDVGVASLYAAAGEPVESRAALFDEKISVVISDGGDTKTGEFRFLVEI